ncbi:hypothetical protein [Loktanella sp. Alg231-35]|uniref:hypothetical protein n=1 Tax=Loktanella sp. Alg231-35 TaxID=1922220 RepID=UPI000D5555B7|nr:hypothetical protein [Loktanella sp. Alg231-35]
MHPPFFTVDHKIGPDIHHYCDEKPIVRRASPTRLDLTPATTGWPPVPLLVTPSADAGSVQLPRGAAPFLRPQLRVVPPPQRTLRNTIGRFLIRAGQRMILENRA